jgi:hypothetical protein
MLKRISFCLFVVAALFMLNGCSNENPVSLNDLTTNNELALNVKTNLYSFALNAIKISNVYENSVDFNKESISVSIAVNSWAGGLVKVRILSGENIIYSKDVSDMSAITEKISGSPDKIEIMLVNFTGQTAVTIKGE